MSAFLKFAALAALAAVARADYLVQTTYSDSACAASVTTISASYAGCTSDGSSSYKVVCGSAPTMMRYSGATCSGSGSPSAGPFANMNCQSGMKYTCATGDPVLSALPTSGLSGGTVAVTYSDAQCTNIKSAVAQYGNGCIANQPSSGQSVVLGCTASSITYNVYSASTTCTGASAQSPGGPIAACAADQSGGYSKTVCMMAAAKSGAASVAAGALAAVAAVAAAVVLA